MSSGPPAEQQELVNIPGQNPVAYVACSSGNNELGFRSFIQTAGMTTGLTDGDKFGVIGDTTTSMNGDNGQGGLAPDGSQYFMISDTDAFVHIHIDAVRVVDYVNVKMGCWVHVESTAWETSDRLRVWASEESGRNDTSGWFNDTEVVVIDATDIANDTALVQDTWVQFTTPIPSMFEVSMRFGLRSNSDDKEVWLDFFRITGSGPDRVAAFCDAGNCGLGTKRVYTAGADPASATCEPCPAGLAYNIADGECQPCAPGTYTASVGATSCIACAAGTYASSTGSGGCTSCDAGRFSASSGMSVCVGNFTSNHPFAFWESF